MANTSHNQSKLVYSLAIVTRYDHERIAVSSAFYPHLLCSHLWIVSQYHSIHWACLYQLSLSSTDFTTLQYHSEWIHGVNLLRLFIGSNICICLYLLGWLFRMFCLLLVTSRGLFPRLLAEWFIFTNELLILLEIKSNENILARSFANHWRYMYLIAYSDRIDQWDLDLFGWLQAWACHYDGAFVFN